MYLIYVPFCKYVLYCTAGLLLGGRLHKRTTLCEGRMYGPPAMHAEVSTEPRRLYREIQHHMHLLSSRGVRKHASDPQYDILISLFIKCW